MGRRRDAAATDAVTAPEAEHLRRVIKKQKMERSLTMPHFFEIEPPPSMDYTGLYQFVVDYVRYNPDQNVEDYYDHLGRFIKKRLELDPDVHGSKLYHCVSRSEKFLKGHQQQRDKITEIACILFCRAHSELSFEFRLIQLGLIFINPREV